MSQTLSKNLFPIFLFLVLMTQCQTREKSSIRTPPTDRRETTSLDFVKNPNIPQAPDVLPINFELGTLRSLALAAVSPGGSRFYHYKICSESEPQDCKTGDFSWGVKIIPKLKTDSYRIWTSACVEAESCSAPVESEWIQKNSEADPSLESLLVEQAQLSDKLRALAPEVHRELALYQEKTFKNQPSSEFDQNIHQQLIAGERVTADQLNSAQFAQMYARYYAPKLGEENSDESLTQLADRLQNLEQKSSPSSQGSVMISLGSTLVLSGVMLAGLSYAGLLSTRHLSAKIQDFQDQGVVVLGEAQKKLAKELKVLSALGPQMTDSVLDGIRAILHRTLSNGSEAYVIVQDPSSVILSKADGSLYYRNQEQDVVLTVSPGDKAGEKIYRNNLGVIEFLVVSDRLLYKAGQGIIVENDKIVLRNYPSMLDTFPKLSEETVERLYRNWESMKAQGRADADTAYVKSAPLFDVDGRLVEPPSSWRNPGVNIYPHNNYLGDYTYDDQAELRWTDPLTGKTQTRNFGKDDKKTLVKTKGVGLVNRLTVGQEDLTWRVELSLRYHQGSILNRLASTSQLAQQEIEKLQTDLELLKTPRTVQEQRNLKKLGSDEPKTKLGSQLLEASTKQKSTSEDLKHKGSVYGQIGMSIGAAIATSGVGILIAGTQLTSDPKDRLLTKLGELERRALDVHKKKWENLAKIKTILQNSDEPMFNEFWIYQL